MVVLGISNLETMEVLVLRKGLALANGLSLRRVRMASDCANAVHGMEGSNLGAYGQIVKELKEDAAMMEIVHESREANHHDAHALARSTLFSSTSRHV